MRHGLKSFALIILSFFVCHLALAQDSKEEGFFSEEDVSQDFFKEKPDDSAYEIKIPEKPAQVDKTSGAPKPELPDVSSATGVESNAAGVINRVKAMIGNQPPDRSVKSVIDSAKSAESFDASGAGLNKETTATTQEGTTSEDAVSNVVTEETTDVDIKDFFSEAKGFSKADKPILSLIVSAKPKNHYLKHLESLLRVSQNKKITIGQIMIVGGTAKDLKSVQEQQEKLMTRYKEQSFSSVYAGEPPAQYQAVSSPIWIAHVGGIDHVYEIGELNPLTLFDDYGNLLIPNEN